MKKLLILGFSSAGKTSAANFIAKIIGGKIANESDYIITDYAKKHKLDPNWVKDHKYDIRNNLYYFARSRQEEDPTYPVKMAFDNGATIITGTRNQDELEAKRSLYDLIIWIDRPGYEAGSTDKLKPGDADIIISATNLDELRQKITNLFKIT